MSNYKVHIVGDGDTIQSIGDLYSVDWTEIVTINGLDYPYIDTTLFINEYEKVDSVAKIGSKLVIPTTDLVIPIKTNNSSQEIENYAFGCDLDIFSTEETDYGVINLEVEGELIDNYKGDIKLVEGLKNLRQQLIIRLGTPVGALLLHPEFGSKLLDYIGKTINEQVLKEVHLEIQECLLKDFRVKGVSDIKSIFKNRSVLVTCKIHPIEPYKVFELNHRFEN